MTEVVIPRNIQLRGTGKNMFRDMEDLEKITCDHPNIINMDSFCRNSRSLSSSTFSEFATNMVNAY